MSRNFTKLYSPKKVVLPIVLRLATKKAVYGLYSVVIIFSLVYFSSSIRTEAQLVRFLIEILSFVLLATLGLHSMSFKTSSLYSYLSTLLLPIYLIVGFVLSLYYFPNLAIVFKVGAGVLGVILLYIIFLVTNIFLVVEEKKAPIPLYSAAITWVQILIIILFIPFMSGIYKTPLTNLAQTFVVFASAFMFNNYLGWAVTHEAGVETKYTLEKLIINSSLAFLPAALSLSVAFFPTETFLKALVIAALIMFNMAYIYGHAKNRLTKRMFIDYGLIVFVFFIILVAFKP